MFSNKNEYDKTLKVSDWLVEFKKIRLYSLNVITDKLLTRFYKVMQTNYVFKKETSKASSK